MDGFDLLSYLCEVARATNVFQIKLNMAGDLRQPCVKSSVTGRNVFDRATFF